jgi:hypothetical protein
MVRVRVKHSIVIHHDGGTLRFGKGAIVDVPDRVYLDNWGMMERLDLGELKIEKVKVLKAPKAKPYAETASIKPRKNAAMRKPKAKTK